MVEKIVVAPNEVRGYGNIVDNDKDKSDLCFYNSFVNADTDLIDGIRIGIMRMIYQDPNLFFSFHQLEKYLYVNSDDMTLSFDSTNKCLVFDDTTESFSLGFDSTNKVLYIGEIGEHDYSIAFSQSSYTASGGSATLEITLLDSNVPVSGASVTVTGSDSSSYTGITNSNGIASVTVTGITAQTTFTCSYGGVTDNCTVNVPTYLFYDECSSSSGLTNYGQIRPISSSTTTSYLEYDSTNNAYYVHANGDWGVIPITALNGLDNYKITAEFKTKSSGNTYQGGIGFIAENGTNNIIFRMYGSSANSIINDSSQQNIGSVSASSKWYRFEVTKQGTSFSVTVTDLSNDTVVGTQTRTTSFGTYYVGFMTVAGQSYGSYVRNVKAESL